jgi:hypothetical protein
MLKNSCVKVRDICKKFLSKNVYQNYIQNFILFILNEQYNSGSINTLSKFYFYKIKLNISLKQFLIQFSYSEYSGYFKKIIKY